MTGPFEDSPKGLSSSFPWRRLQGQRQPLPPLLELDLSTVRCSRASCDQAAVFAAGLALARAPNGAQG